MLNPATGILVEGIPATGKSTVINRLLKREEIIDRNFMPFFTFGEEITQRVLEKKHNQGVITRRDNLELLESIIAPLEQYQKYYRQRGWQGADAKPRFAFLLERFHLTHSIYFDHINWPDLLFIDQRLNKLNTKLCFLYMEQEVMEERIITSRSLRWRRYISRFGQSNQGIINYYYQQQEKKRGLVKESSLPSLMIDTSRGDWGQYVEEILDFWGIRS